MHQIHRAACPHCQNINLFDNRDGRLDQIVRDAARDRDTSSRSASFTPTPAAAPLPDPPLRERLNNLPTPPRPVPKPSQPAARKPTRSGIVSKIRDEVLYIRGRGGLPGGSSVKLALAAALVIGALALGVIIVTLQIPDFYLSNPDEFVSRMKNVEANRILDRKGDVIAELFAKKTGSLKQGELPESIKKKFVFVEDQSFYAHAGIHWPSVIRAVIRNIFSFGYAQGGSTITQQLARILLADQQKTMFRKFREASLAYHLERRFSKEEIITAYANHVYLGHGATGVDVASQFYFGKELKELNFSEELILASLPSAPERFSPIKNPDELEHKLDAVFDRMQSDKFTDMSLEAFQKEKRGVLEGLNRSPKESVFGNRLNNAPFLAEYIRVKIKELVGDGYEFGAGLRIETTVDARLQVAAVRESKRFIQSVAGQFPPVRIVDKRYVGDGGLETQIAKEYVSQGLGAVLFGMPQSTRKAPSMQTASIGIDPRTGEILFIQGGTEFASGNQLNRAIAMRRQTGSAIKPIVYSAGIESGAITPATPIEDTPIYAQKERHKATDRDYWLPENITGVYEGQISARRALVHSKNVPAIRVARMTGLPRVGEQFKKFFFPQSGLFDRRFRFDDTIAIGSLEMSPLEMASAFSAFGNNGVIRRPFLIKRILDHSGKELYVMKGDEFALQVPPERVAIPGDVAEVMASMLSQSAAFGGVGAGGYYGQVLGKTGTTNDNKDAWFVGVTPTVSMAVWVGYDDPAFSMPGATGAGLAGPLWGRIASAGGVGGGGFGFSPRAARLRVCRDSGLVPRPGCPETIDEMFALAHVPREKCDRHTDEKKTGKTGDSLNKDSDFN